MRGLPQKKNRKVYGMFAFYNRYAEINLAYVEMNIF